MKILIAAGGTAGHLYPGIVLAEELKKINHEVFLVIRENGREKSILQSRR
ncbi:MAG TPA: hypothetical protein DHV62_01910 [Elusimicrobia bacterium]|nr:hypothetical protein [Elusimicrobiota bacterium]